MCFKNKKKTKCVPRGEETGYYRLQLICGDLFVADQDKFRSNPIFSAVPKQNGHFVRWKRFSPPFILVPLLRNTIRNVHFYNWSFLFEYCFHLPPVSGFSRFLWWKIHTHCKHCEWLRYNKVIRLCGKRMWTYCNFTTLSLYILFKPFTEKTFWKRLGLHSKRRWSFHV